MGEVCDSSFFNTGGPLHAGGKATADNKSHPSHPLLPFGHEQDMVVCPLLMLEEQCKNGCGVR